MTFEVFHLEISDKFDNEENLSNILFIFTTFVVSHLEISGKANNCEHPQKI